MREARASAVRVIAVTRLARSTRGCHPPVNGSRECASDDRLRDPRSAFSALAASSGKISAIALCVPITRARALLNGLAPAHRPAPFGEADAAERQPEFAQLLQGTPPARTRDKAQCPSG